MQSIAIIAMSIAAAVVYGIALDQITVRVCIEYFTIGHPPVFSTADPTLLALGWGVIATWWAGLFVGIQLAIAARAGSHPQRTAGSLVPSIAILFVCMAVFALVASVVGWILARSGYVFLVGPLADMVPQDRHVPFLADLWAHTASYLAGAVGGLAISIKVWRSRSQNRAD